MACGLITPFTDIENGSVGKRNDEHEEERSELKYVSEERK